MTGSADWFGSTLQLAALGQTARLSSLGRNQEYRREEQRIAVRPSADVPTQPIGGRAAVQGKSGRRFGTSAVRMEEVTASFCQARCKVREKGQSWWGRQHEHEGVLWRLKNGVRNESGGWT